MHKSLLNLLYKKYFVKMRPRVKNTRRRKTDGVTCTTTALNQNGECDISFHLVRSTYLRLFLTFDYTAVGLLAGYDCYPH